MNVRRLALPINNKPIRAAQSELEEIYDRLKVPGSKYDPVISFVKKAEKLIETKKPDIIADVKGGRSEEAQKMLEVS